MLVDHIAKESIELDEHKITKLEQFAALLHEWNQIHNLTGAKTISAIYDNIIDSLYPGTFIDSPSSLLDVGTGSGFPGMILGIMYDRCATVLCEPRNKRAAFLKYVVHDLGLENVTVAKMRVEDLTHEPFALISSRAVTDTEMLLNITQHLSSPQTQYLFYKGSHIAEELDIVGHQLNYDIVQRNKRNYLWIHN